ncbi:adenosylcobinamide-phosphate synthase CbiB [Vagococcus sp.]|uniref:adenosylcobinamide-phosphate synthase CbiB n=1 Tax=Vagococcus sp. TaxID=1933889 RepID=UPI002FC7F9B5
MTVLLIAIAFVLDLILGDPYHWPHPIKVIGNYISFFKKNMLTDKLSTKQKYLMGGVLWISTVFLGSGATWLILKVAYSFNIYLGHLVFIYLSYTTLATKSLAKEGKKIADTLKNGTIEDARKQVAMIVGRDTSQLTEEEIAKATIETIAENTSDGVIAPMLCLFIGGPVLAMAYKAINTLDSMVGYLTPEYREIGYVSAKMDDLWNLIPARISFLLLGLSSILLNMNPKETFVVGWRDRKNHKSPNGGYLEAPASGALGIQLGGSHVYHGVEIYKPTIGESLKEVDRFDILKMNLLLYCSASIGMVLFSVISYIIKGF